MAAKGSVAKAEIIAKILETFPDSFAFNDGKEVRINCIENDELVQIKVTLTAAKVPVEGGTTPAVTKANDNAIEFATETIPDEPTPEEKEKIANILASLPF